MKNDFYKSHKAINIQDPQFLDECMLWVIDQQNFYVDPDFSDHDGLLRGGGTPQTAMTAHKNAAYIDRYRDLGMKVCFINKILKGTDGTAKADQIYGCTPGENDLIFYKHNNSPYAQGTVQNNVMHQDGFQNIMDDHRVKTVFVVGFGTSRCFADTIQDAMCVHGLNVVGIADGTENSLIFQDTAKITNTRIAQSQKQKTLTALSQNGAYIVGQEQALQYAAGLVTMRPTEDPSISMVERHF